jgi:putative sterol carrier protein
MTDHTTEFFNRLSSEPQPLLSKVTATIRVDIDDRNHTRHWYLDVDKGKVAVSDRMADADAIVKSNHSLFERVVTGEVNTLAAALRGQIALEGDRRLLVAFQRLLPGPPADSTASLPTKGASR